MENKLNEIEQAIVKLVKELNDSRKYINEHPDAIDAKYFEERIPQLEELKYKLAVKTYLVNKIKKGVDHTNSGFADLVIEKE